MTLIPALGRQMQAYICEFKASLVYKMSSKTGSKATQKSCLKKPKIKQNKMKKKIKKEKFEAKL